MTMIAQNTQKSNFSQSGQSESNHLVKLETLGARFCPIVWGDKRPHGQGWQKNPLSLSQVNLSKQGIGILLGHSNLLAIDIDNSKGRDRFIEYFGVAPSDYPSVSWASGKNFDGEHQPEIGHTSNIQILLKLSDTQATQLEGRKVFKNNTLDLRWHGCQSVLPSRSPHPSTGHPYFWHHSPSEYAIASMPAAIWERMLADLSSASSVQPTSAPTIPLTYTDDPPLTIFLAKEHRQHIDAGAPQGSRNDAGFRLASDLIGTEARLAYLEIPHTERARDLFDIFCDRCSPSLNGEREVIWKSATKTNPTACLTDEMIEKCKKAWVKRQRTMPQPSASVDKETGEKPETPGDVDEAKTPQKFDSHWAAEIAEQYHELLAWDDTAKEWRMYEAGIWKVTPSLKIGKLIKSYMLSQGKGCTNGKLSSIESILKMDLYREEWDNDLDLIPFQDGVFSLKKSELLPHNHQYSLTWQLPRNYECETDEWPQINEWLNFATKGNQGDKNILIAFAAATLKGQCYLEKFLHLQGPGGTGKSTYLRLLEDLTGLENCYSSSLSEWNTCRFESANGYGKRLIMFSDESKQIGNIENLKKLTGGNAIRFEEKGKKATNYRYNGMVVICSNDPIFVGDSISAIARRHIQLFFTAIVPKEKRKNLTEIFKAELPAFTKYLLKLSNDWIKQTLDNSQGYGGLTAQSWTDTCRTNSIAAWTDEHIIWDVTGAEKIGNTKAEGDEKFDDCTSLYQSYSLFCQRAGYFAVNCRNFSELLNEVAITLGKEVTKIHTRTGKQLHGIKLRKAIRDAEIPTYTEILEKAENPDPTPSPNPVAPVPVTDGDGYGDGCVTDSVTDETLAVYGCDGCDGLKPNLSNDFSGLTESPSPNPVTPIPVTDGDGCGDGCVTDSVTDETLTVYGCDGCDGLKPNFSNDAFSGLSDSEIKELASDLLRAAKDDDIEIFQLLLKTYELNGNGAHKKRAWAAMTPDEKAIIKNFTDKHK